MDFEIVEVYSEKYDVHGKIIDYFVVTELEFSYEGKEILTAISKPYPYSEEELKRSGVETIDTYIEKLQSGEIKLCRQMLHYWHVDKKTDDETGKEYLQAHGIVTGHKRLQDSMYIHTSVIKEITINHDTKEAQIQTKNTLYYCPLAYCDFEKQEQWPEVIPDYENIKEKYKDTIEEPTIESGKVLLVLSNFNNYYFHSLYYVPEGETEPIKYSASPHIGMFQDSFLINGEGWKKIDLRYFPHYQNIEFYSQNSDGKPLFIENIGNITLYVKAFCGTIKLEPGDRKEVTKENTEPDVIGLPKGDLYPAAIISEGSMGIMENNEEERKAE